MESCQFIWPVIKESVNRSIFIHETPSKNLSVAEIGHYALRLLISNDYVILVIWICIYTGYFTFGLLFYSYNFSYLGW